MTGQGDVAAPPRSRSRTVSAAWRDLTRGYGQRQLWLQLGWQDIKQRYRRSTLGPLWITIATGAMAVTMEEDFASPVDEDQVWSVWKGNARVKR